MERANDDTKVKTEVKDALDEISKAFPAVEAMLQKDPMPEGESERIVAGKRILAELQRELTVFSNSIESTAIEQVLEKFASLSHYFTHIKNAIADGGNLTASIEAAKTDSKELRLQNTFLHLSGNEANASLVQEVPVPQLVPVQGHQEEDHQEEELPQDQERANQHQERANEGDNQNANVPVQNEVNQGPQHEEMQHEEMQEVPVPQLVPVQGHQEEDHQEEELPQDQERANQHQERANEEDNQNANVPVRNEVNQGPQHEEMQEVPVPQLVPVQGHQEEDHQEEELPQDQERANQHQERANEEDNQNANVPVRNEVNQGPQHEEMQEVPVPQLVSVQGHQEEDHQEEELPQDQERANQHQERANEEDNQNAGEVEVEKEERADHEEHPADQNAGEEEAQRVQVQAQRPLPQEGGEGNQYPQQFEQQAHHPLVQGVQLQDRYQAEGQDDERRANEEDNQNANLNAANVPERNEERPDEDRDEDMRELKDTTEERRDEGEHNNSFAPLSHDTTEANLDLINSMRDLESNSSTVVPTRAHHTENESHQFDRASRTQNGNGNKREFPVESSPFVMEQPVLSSQTTNTQGVEEVPQGNANPVDPTTEYRKIVQEFLQRLLNTNTVGIRDWYDAAADQRTPREQVPTLRQGVADHNMLKEFKTCLYGPFELYPANVYNNGVTPEAYMKIVLEEYKAVCEEAAVKLGTDGFLRGFLETLRNAGASLNEAQYNDTVQVYINNLSSFGLPYPNPITWGAYQGLTPVERTNPEAVFTCEEHVAYPRYKELCMQQVRGIGTMVRNNITPPSSNATPPSGLKQTANSLAGVLGIISTISEVAVGALFLAKVIPPTVAVILACSLLAVAIVSLVIYVMTKTKSEEITPPTNDGSIMRV